jgi:hypothetical protein
MSELHERTKALQLRREEIIPIAGERKRDELHKALVRFAERLARAHERQLKFMDQLQLARLELFPKQPSR